MLSTADPILLIVIFVGLAIAPFAAMMATSFTKIAVVLNLLRNALGVQQIPPTIVLNGLAIILSIYVMYPVGIAAYQSAEANINVQQNHMNISSLLSIVDDAKKPLKDFLIKHSRPNEREFFMASSKTVMGEQAASTLKDDDLVILLPAFVSAELTQAFQIGFLLFLPFIVIDMIVAAVLMAMGMQMMSPTTISLPIKLLLFVMLDGWSRLLHALVLSYR